MNINQNKIKLTSYISINGWMISNLPKVGVSTMNEVMIFAIIYSYSKEPDTMFTGALPYLIKQSLTSRTTCIKILTKLTELQLIFKKVDGQRNYYYVNQSKLHELQNEMPEAETSLKLNQSKVKPVQNPNQTGTESELYQSNFRTRPVQNPNQTGTETTPNNIIYPINNKTDKIDIKKKYKNLNSVNVIVGTGESFKKEYRTDNETISWFKIDEDKFQYMKKEISVSKKNHNLSIEDVFDEVLSLTQNNVIGDAVYSQQITCLIILYALRRRYPTKEKKSCTPIDTPTKFENLKSDLVSCAKGNIVKSLTNAISNCWNSVPTIDETKTFNKNTAKDDKWRHTNDNDYSGDL